MKRDDAQPDLFVGDLFVASPRLTPATRRLSRMPPFETGAAPVATDDEDRLDFAPAVHPRTTPIDSPTQE